VSRLNLAQAIWEACMNGILPERIPLIGRAVIEKDNPQSWGFGRIWGRTDRKSLNLAR
jgi:hypothetical protein